MGNPSIRLQEALDNVGKTGAPVIFIDDSGLPGSAIEGISSEEKIFSAVVVPPSCSQEVLKATFDISRELQKISSQLLAVPTIKEFHFCHICHGRHEFESVPVEARIGMLEFMATFLMYYPMEIVTVGWEESRNRELLSEGLPQRLGPFNFKKREHTALLFLLLKLRDYVEKKAWIALPSVFCDEGFAKHGMVLMANLPFLRSFFEKALFFVDSKTVPGIQIADFAAFMLARHKVVLDKWQKGRKLNQIDSAIIEIMNSINAKYSNLPKRLVLKTGSRS